MKTKKLNKLVILLTIISLFIPMLSTYAATEKYTPSGISFSELESQIDAVVAKHLGIATPGAAVVVVHDGEIIFSKGYGYADIENNIMVDPATTIFDFASVGKLFVWVSAKQLVDKGLLDLDTDIATYLPADFNRHLNLKYPVTMRDLMNHSAGFEQTAFDITADVLATDNLISLQEALENSTPKQFFPPGKASNYSNYGVALAAYVVSCITGLDYADYERENIFLRSGMMNTVSLPHYINNPDFSGKRAIPYTPDREGHFTRDLGNVKMTIWPAGMTCGTAEDLARFALSLMPREGESSPLFENLSSLNGIFTPSSHDPKNTPGTHHGFWHYRGVTPSFGHAGHSHHFTNFAIMPEEKFGFLSISNGFEDVNVAISNLLLGFDHGSVKPRSDNLPPTSEVVGSYQLLQARFESNFLAFVNSLSPANTVIALDENTIEVNSLMFGKATYRQIEPYLYQIISPDNQAMTLYFNTLKFTMEDGKPAYIHVGDGKDFDFMPPNPFSGLLLAGFVVSIVFFIFFPIVLLIAFWVNKKKGVAKTRFGLFSNCFFFAGTFLVLNNLILFIKVITATILDDKQTAELRDTLSKKLNKEIRLDVDIDPSVVAGPYIYVDGYYLDWTFKTRLRELTVHMKEGV